MKKNKTRPLAFDRVLATDGIARALLALARAEGLLYSNTGEDLPGGPATPKERQAALSLLVLFDKLVVHQLGLSQGEFRVPDLERDGILEVVVAQGMSSKTRPLRSTWKPSKDDPRPRAHVQLRRSLALLEIYKPLVIDRLLSRRSKFESAVASTLRISRRAYLSQFLDLSISYVLGNRQLLGENIIEQAFPADFLKDFKRELFDFEARSEAGEVVLSPANVTLLMALLFAEELDAIQELSASRGLGVATQHYARASRKPRSDDGFDAEPSKLPRSFGVVRSIIHEEAHFFPEIENFDHALKLRKNPHLRAFREEFRQFHLQLAKGDIEGLQNVRQEVKRAAMALARLRKWNRALHWLTYISLPAGVVESLFTGLPIVGTALGVLSVVGTATTAHATRRSEWVMFGG